MFKYDKVFVYMDDLMIIRMSTLNEHFKDVNDILQRLEEFIMQVDPLKSYWDQEEVEYIGFMINNNLIHLLNLELQILWLQ